MVDRKLNISRDQLSQFLPDHQTIRTFEEMFAVVTQIAPNVVEEIKIESQTALSTANEALAEIDRVGNTADISALAPINDTLSQINNIDHISKLSGLEPISEKHNSISTNYIDFERVSPHTHRVGRASWNSVENTIDVDMPFGVIQQVGLETFGLVINNTGATLTNGTVLGFGGVSGGYVSAIKYLADGSMPALYLIGVLTHDLPNGQIGYCTTFGYVRDINTSGFSIGDILYASPTTAGEFTNVKPTAPNVSIPVAAVLVSDATQGVIIVRPTLEQDKLYGLFTKTTDQSPAAIDTEYLVTFDNVETAHGVSIGTPASRIVVEDSGLYEVVVNIQLTSNSASQKNVWFWFKKNGVSISNTSRILTSDLNNGYLPLAISKPFMLNAGDYFEIAFAADDVNVTIDNVAATGFAPSAPAVVLYVTQVQQ